MLVLFPLVFLQFESPAAFFGNQPAGFFSLVNEPFSPLYVLAFYLLVLLSYNGNWALAQKFYCVRDEKAARKTGWLAAGLMFVGPPLFILPAIAARSLMPELMSPPNSPQYTYAALAIRFLPAGLMGLMIAAMFSATMSTLSGDYNVVASVITKDIYQRLMDKNATERRLVFVGRFATLGVGIATTLIGISLMGTANKGLFETMVTLFGLFVGPMLIPMLLGLLTRAISWRGAAAGIVCGLIAGLSFYLFKTLVLARQPGLDPTWLRYNFEAISILSNFAITTAAIFIVTLFERKTQIEQAQIDAFFHRLETPIAADRVEAAEVRPEFSPFHIIGAVTVGTGLLLLIASVTQQGGTGRAINISVGLSICLIGGGLYWLHGWYARQARAHANRNDKVPLNSEVTPTPVREEQHANRNT